MMGEGFSHDLEGARAALLQYFGYSAFRPGQEQVIGAILDGRDALAVMPTGAGKSICYQVPAAMLAGLTIVVSPLVSLMADQVRSLKEVGIRGSFYNSTLKPHVRPEVLRRAEAGWYDLMYVAPERLGDQRFRAFAARADVPLVAVDEAHCVSQWGQDFRPAYCDIRGFVETLPTRPPVVALTATATGKVRDDIVGMLGLRNPQQTVTGFDRPNLFLATYELTPKHRKRWLVNYIRSHPGDPGIVYVPTRRKVEQIADMLRAEGIPAVGYHAGMSDDTRTSAQEAFVNDDALVIVATNAFGMGIDKSNVRFVVNCGLPLSLEEYYQEAGRAGRDGERAECYLLWSPGDIRTAHFFIDNTEFGAEVAEDDRRRLIATKERLLGSMIGYAQGRSCLRERILGYFGQLDAKSVGVCGGCSVCTGETADGYLRQRRPSGGRAGVRAADRVRAMREDDDHEYTAGEEALFQRLRRLRKRLADEAAVPPYVVFSDRTLRAMVRRRPESADELLAIPGVGEVKLERYGDDFLALLRGDA